jgi:hypothetical protein
MVFRIEHLVGLCFLLILGACGKKDLADYAHYLTDATSGLTQKQSKGKMGFSVTYQPLDFVAGRQLEANKRNKSSFEKAKAAYLGMQYVNFELYTEGVAAGQNALKQLIEKQVGEEKWTETLSYYNFGMQPDLGIISGIDTLPCAFYHLEQTGNLGNRLRFFVGFKDDKKLVKPNFTNDLRLYYFDRTMSKDTLYFIFSKDKLNQTPDLKL